MEIRHTRTDDLPVLRTIFDNARRFMVRTGNPNQWEEGFPPQAVLEADIQAECSYVCVEDGRILATFFFSTAGEPTYRVIREGAWLDAAPYGVVHRIAAAEQGHGAAAYCLDWCLAQCGNIRIDTHRRQQTHAAAARAAGLCLLWADRSGRRARRAAGLSKTSGIDKTRSGTGWFCSGLFCIP